MIGWVKTNLLQGVKLMSKSMTLKPHLSEKAYALSKSDRTYVFVVPRQANKLSVTSAIKSQFDVSIARLNVLNAQGKRKRTIHKGARAGVGRRSNTKKAYVTLNEGSSLPFFVEEEKAEAKAKKDEEKTKKPDDKVVDTSLTETKVSKKRSLRQAFSRTPRQTQNRGGEK